MNAIGGYFELELRKDATSYMNALAFNSGKNCLEFLLLCQHYTKVYLPYFTCDVIYKPFERLGVPYELYNIDCNLEPTALPVLKEGEAFLYTNYFGLKDVCVTRLAKKYGKQLIVDNAQAFFAKPLKGINTFYSPRKFIGVPDGGYLYLTDEIKSEYYGLKQSISYNRIGHLIKRIDISPEAAYQDFKSEDESLVDEPVMRMSNLTQRLLSNVDYEFCRDKRRKNFQILDKVLRTTNKWQGVLDDSSVPMVYPYWTDDASLRQRLIDNHIYVAQYWPNVLDWCQQGDLEYEFASNLIPLPIDQRYGEEEMKKIIKIICTSQK